MLKIRNITCDYREYDSERELDPADRELLSSAAEAARSAYAPYSGFKVGASVRLASGVIVSGSNVENAAFPSGICAERNALANASANHPGDIPVSIAIMAFSADEPVPDPVSPCGNCRQVISEEEIRNGNSIRIILGSAKKVHLIEKGGDLLPLQFSRENLKVTRR